MNLGNGPYSEHQLDYISQDQASLAQDDDVEMTHSDTGLDLSAVSSYGLGSHIPADVDPTSARVPVDDASQEKVRKKPGRKPGPSCPALRKEQNRAAQRAFRDRKERHLHQLENMIRDLKDQHYLVTSQFQRQIRDLKVVVESLQSENFYLREVVFAFESALSKGNHTEILHEVKGELFRRHYESRAAAKKSLEQKQQQQVQDQMPTSPHAGSVPSTPHSAPSIASPRTSSVSMAPMTPDSTTTGSMSPRPTTASVNRMTIPGVTPESVLSATESGAGGGSEGHAPNQDGYFSFDGEILYRAPPLFIQDFSEEGKSKASVSHLAPLSVPRPAYLPPGTTLPKHTDYTKHPTVFDELQSSLFPPGTLESLHINMATPQEVVSDDSLFESLQGKPSESWETLGKSSSGLQSFRVNLARRPGEVVEKEVVVTDEILDKVCGVLQRTKDVVRSHRIFKECCVLCGAEPVTDPKIDPKVYEVPHDYRIDYIPCPKLRAQLIVHQHRYDPDELFRVFCDGAICHGPPLDKDSWQMPDEFFDRFGFLLGLELERIRTKIWPKREPSS